MTIERLNELKEKAQCLYDCMQDWLNEEEKRELSDDFSEIRDLIIAEIERKKDPINEIIGELKTLEDEDDYELAHHKADILLCELLLYLGHEEAVDAWENVGKYYS